MVLVANVSDTAIIGRTVFVDAIENPPTVLFSNSNPIVNDFQSNIGGIKTIDVAKVEISTINYPSKYIFKNSNYIQFME